MTESEWDACNDPRPMLHFLLPRASERKLCLFACVCCRRVWHLMTDSRHRHAVEAAERFLDGLLSETEFAEAMQPVIALWADLPSYQEEEWKPAHYMTGAARHLEGGGAASYAASYTARGLACLAGAEESPSWLAAQAAEEAAQCGLLRDIFGYPSRPFHFDAAWLDAEGGAAVELARAIYDEGRFADVPLLAEVLERAGCRDRTVLEHCRGSQTHVRGCWVVDALLGRESAVRAGLMTEDDWQTCDDPEPLLHFLRDKGSNRKWRLFAVACCRRIEHLIIDERSRQAVVVAARYADGEASEEELQAAHAAAQQAQDEARTAEYRAEAEANFCLTPEYAAACCRLYAACAARNTVCSDTRVADAEPGSYGAECWHPSNEMAEAVRENTHAVFGNAPDDPRWEECLTRMDAAQAAEWRAHCMLLRDLFGDLFGPPAGNGCWLPFGPPIPLPENRPQQWCLLPTPRKTFLRREWMTWNGGIVPKIVQTIYAECAFDRLPILADALEEAGCDNADILNHCRQPGEHVRGCWVIDLLLGKS